MNRSRLRATALTALVLLLAAGASGQSVADVARKSKNSKEKKATVVITNDHLKSVKKEPAAAPVYDGTTMTPAAGGPERTANEEFYFKKFKGYLAQIDEMETRVLEWNKQGLLASNAYMQRLRDAKDDFAHFKELARKAGIPPGVLRAAEKDFAREKEERARK